jgi:hypothetical protein
MTPSELYETVLNGNWSAIREADTEELWDFVLNPVPEKQGIYRRVLKQLYSRYSHPDEVENDTISDAE